MNSRANVLIGSAGCFLLCWVAVAPAADWPQWRGPNRDARVTGFEAPASWPQELTKKWEETIGDGAATPSIVGDRIYAFSRDDGNEIIRCLNATSGEEIWSDSYPTEGTTGGASGFPGPRASPTVADGKVVTFGVRGVLSCLDATSGDILWRKDNTGSWPIFYTSSSPIVVNGLCIAQVGGRDDGAIVAYDLASGEERWRWSGESPAYGSPVLIHVGGTPMVLAPTGESLVGIGVDGKEMWKIQYQQGRNTSATPIVDGDTVILAGPGSGMSAIRLEMSGGEVTEEQTWINTDNSVQFNTPVLKDGMIYGLSGNNTLFCIHVANHETAWSAPLGGASEQAGREGGGPPFAGRGSGGDREGRGRGEGRPARGDRPARDGAVEQASAEETVQNEAAAPAEAEQAGDAQADQRRGRFGRGGGEARGEGGDRRGRGRGGRGGRGGGRGYGSVVDAGSVLMALTPAMDLVVFEPSATEFKELARYKVSESPTYAYPVPTENGIYIKDKDSVALWTIE